MRTNRLRDPTNLTLDCGSIDVQGEGSSLTLLTRGSRVNKLGRYESYDLCLKIDRWAIHRLARAIATMHVRDRARLDKELKRIELETAAIKQPNVEQT